MCCGSPSLPPSLSPTPSLPHSLSLWPANNASSPLDEEEEEEEEQGREVSAGGPEGRDTHARHHPRISEKNVGVVINNIVNIPRFLNNHHVSLSPVTVGTLGVGWHFSLLKPVEVKASLLHSSATKRATDALDELKHLPAFCFTQLGEVLTGF